MVSPVMEGVLPKGAVIATATRGGGGGGGGWGGRVL